MLIFYLNKHSEIFNFILFLQKVKVGGTRIALAFDVTPRLYDFVSDNVAKFAGPSIDEGAVDRWENIMLRAPSLPPSRLDGCKNIDISYVFKVFGSRNNI